MDTKRFDIEENPIDIKEIFTTLYRYKFSIIAITILFAAVNAYFKPNIFSTTSTVEIGVERSGGKTEDILAMSASSGYVNTNTEIQIIKSRFLAEQAIQNVDFLHRYHTTVRLREVELYKSSFFDVNLTKGYNLSFSLYPYDEGSYRVEAKGIDKGTREAWEVNKVYPFGERAESDHYAFALALKEGGKLENSNYRFVVLSEASTVGSAKGGVSVKRLGRYSNILAISYRDGVPPESTGVHQCIG